MKEFMEECKDRVLHYFDEHQDLKPIFFFGFGFLFGWLFGRRNKEVVYINSTSRKRGGGVWM